MDIVSEENLKVEYHSNLDEWMWVGAPAMCKNSSKHKEQYV